MDEVIQVLYKELTNLAPHDRVKVINSIICFINDMTNNERANFQTEVDKRQEAMKMMPTINVPDLNPMNLTSTSKQGK